MSENPGERYRLTDRQKKSERKKTIQRSTVP